MTEFQLLESLEKLDAIINNSHIVYTSGKHGDSYVNKDAMYPHTQVTSTVCLEIAEHFKSASIDVVLAPAIGGVILSQWVAHHLTQITGREVISVYAEKVPNSDDFIIKRGYDKFLPGRNVLIVEDVLTTGGSVRKVIELANGLKAHVAGVGALCNRGGLTKEALQVPIFFPLLTVDLSSWPAEECPLCKKGVPINTQVGKGKEFLASVRS